MPIRTLQQLKQGEPTWPAVPRRGALADHGAQAPRPRVGMQAEALERAPRATQLQPGLTFTSAHRTSSPYKRSLHKEVLKGERGL